MARKLLEEVKKKTNCAGEKLEWLLPISSTRSRPSFEVVACRAPGAHGRGRVVRDRDDVHARTAERLRTAARATASAHAHDLGQTGRGRGMDLVS